MSELREPCAKEEVEGEARFAGEEEGSVGGKEAEREGGTGGEKEGSEDMRGSGFMENE